MKSNAIPRFLTRRRAPLPSETDFDPHHGELDAQNAWKNFGGLSIERAYGLFVSRPDIYQEDFMFMGCRAFEYYFPVLDRYLREIERNGDGAGDCESSILGLAVAAQFEGNSGRFSDRLLEEVQDLVSFVFSNTHRYAATPKDIRRIKRAWNEASRAIDKHTNACLRLKLRD